MRSLVAANNPLCVMCQENGVVEMGVVCDHIIPLYIDWERRLDATNLQMLCRACDNKKRAEEHKLYKGR